MAKEKLSYAQFTPQPDTPRQTDTEYFFLALRLYRESVGIAEDFADLDTAEQGAILRLAQKLKQTAGTAHNG